jgi:ribose transport system permease protein
LAAGAAVGLVNSVVVVALRIPSLIGTLAVMGIVGAVAIGVSGNKTVSGPRLAGSFGEIAQGSVHDFAWPVIYVVVLMILLGIFLEQTQTGRYLYATGFSADAARLAGLRVARLQTGSLVIAGILGAWAGIVLTAQLSSSTPSAGSSYLLPAFAAVFLGATQFRDLRFNAWGTVVAVFMLATGQYGLLLSGAPQWTPDVFQGTALIAAVGVTQIGSRRRGVTTADPGAR